MKPDGNRKKLSSRSLLEQIGVSAETGINLLDEDNPFESPNVSLAKGLVERFEALQTRHVFKPGDLVVWKPGLLNRRFPKDNCPAVVVEVLATPIHDQELDSGSTYYREPLDVVLGVFAEDEGRSPMFMTWHFDSRRFQPWVEEA